jgi:hypothetical protein
MIRMWLNERMDTDDKRMCTGVKETNLLHYTTNQLTTTYYSIQPVSR